MLNMVECSGIILLMGTMIMLAKGEELTWNEAYSFCKQENKIIRAKNSTSDLYTSGQSWTANYVVHFRCVDKIALYIEQRPETEEHQALCRDIKNNKKFITKTTSHNYSHADFTCKWDHRPLGRFPDSLLRITSAAILNEAIGRMDLGMKYWISGIDLHFCPFYRQCEKERSINHTKQIYLTNCDEKHSFICVEDIKYKTTISIVRVIPDSNKEGRSYDSSALAWRVPTVIISVILIVGIVIASLILRRCYRSLKQEINQLREQGYNQPMYNADPIRMIQNAPEPQTPISPTGTDIYENFLNAGTEAEDNIRFSYRTTTQVEATVEVSGQGRQTASGIQTNVRLLTPFPALQKPPRCSRDRNKHQSLTHHYHNGMRLLDSRQTSTEPAASRRFPLEYCLRGMPEEWFRCQDEALYTKPQKPKPSIKCDTSDENVYIGPDGVHYTNTCHQCEGSNQSLVEPEDYENIWQEQ